MTKASKPVSDSGDQTRYRYWPNFWKTNNLHIVVLSKSQEETFSPFKTFMQISGGSRDQSKEQWNRVIKIHQKTAVSCLIYTKESSFLRWHWTNLFGVTRLLPHFMFFLCMAHHLSGSICCTFISSILWMFQYANCRLRYVQNYIFVNIFSWIPTIEMPGIQGERNSGLF